MCSLYISHQNNDPKDSDIIVNRKKKSDLINEFQLIDGFLYVGKHDDTHLQCFQKTLVKNILHIYRNSDMAAHPARDILYKM